MTQSQKRYKESLAPLFQAGSGPKSLVLLKSSSDVGVMRNGGRNGAKYAPQSFLSFFKKLNQDAKIADYSLFEAEVASETEEAADFATAQTRESERIGGVLDSHIGARICHLGGGHDHVLPFLRALSKGRKKVVVINIDAHADTRTDSDPHSGTPFRQFAHEFQGDFHLFQIGLHAFANSMSTLSDLPRGQMEILWRPELAHRTRVDEFFNAIKSTVSQEALVVFSVDADALDGSEVPGVSAVNPWGITFNELLDLWMRYQQLDIPHAPILGIYELNPVYDSISMVSMRRMAAFLYETLRI